MAALLALCGGMRSVYLDALNAAFQHAQLLQASFVCCQGCDGARQATHSAAQGAADASEGYPVVSMAAAWSQGGIPDDVAPEPLNQCTVKQCACWQVDHLSRQSVAPAMRMMRSSGSFDRPG